MRILVTGASGFIGSSLIEELSRQGHETFALMRRTSSAANLGGVPFQRIEGDLEDFDSLKKAVQGMDLIYHLAGAITAPSREKYFEWNAEGTRRLGQAILDSGVALQRLVFVSSLAAGGPARNRTPRQEVDPDAPVSAYGESKLQAENYLLQWKDRIPLTIVRPPLVYGPKDRATFVFVQTVARNLIPVFRGSGGAHGSPDGKKYYSTIHVRDLVQGLILGGQVTLDQVPSGEIFYLSAEKDCSYDELMGAIAAQLGKKPWKIPLPLSVLTVPALALTVLGKMTRQTFPLNLDKMNELAPDYWTCSNAKAQRLLTFRPKYDVATGWAETVSWYQQQQWI